MPENSPSNDPIAEQMRVRIASNLDIDPDRIRWINAKTPGQFGETGWRWEIYFEREWRELPWHYNGPLNVTRELVRKWYQ